MWPEAGALDYKLIKVRDVAPRKFAWCIDIRVPEEIGFASEPYKKLKIEEESKSIN